MMKNNALDPFKGRHIEIRYDKNPGPLYGIIISEPILIEHLMSILVMLDSSYIAQMDFLNFQIKLITKEEYELKTKGD